MKPDWPLVRQTFLMGLFLTGIGVVLVVVFEWDDATLICLVVGPFMLISSLVLALFNLYMARSGNSRLPENWESLSLEERHEFARKRPWRKVRKGNNKI